MANNDNDQTLLLLSSGVHVCADRADAVHDSGFEGYQQEDEQEERQMSEAMVVIVLAAFLFGMIMGLCLGKTNK